MIMKHNILYLYFFWYFVEIPKFLLYIWKNIIDFIFDYFTIYGLSKTLFWPYKRYRLYAIRPFNIGNFFERISFNFFSRAIGFFLRIGTISLGLICEIIVLILGLVLFIFWLILPFILIYLIYAGINTIIKS